MNRAFDRTGTQADIHREFDPILSPPNEVETNAHWAHMGRGDIVSAVGDMPCSHPLRKQYLERPIEHLIEGVAEELPNLRIGQEDGAALIGDKKRIGRQIE